MNAGKLRTTRRLAAGFAVLVVLTVGLMLLGALVRAHGAGLACPDWPLCFGEFIPALNLRVAFEFSHRVAAGSVALLFLGLSIVTWRRPGAAATRPLIALAAGLLALQIVLGALTVWKLLAAWTVTSHLVVANLFAIALLLIACTLRADDETAQAVSPAARRWLALAAVMLALQVVLGGLVSSRFAGLACPEWPTCDAGVWFPSWRGNLGLHLLHRWNGTLLLGVLVTAARACRHHPRLARLTRLAIGLGVTQVGVGVANVALHLPIEVTGLHSALAAVLVLVLARTVWEAWRAR